MSDLTPLAKTGSAAGAADAETVPLSLAVNGLRREIDFASWTTLRDLLRETFDLIGTKKGCDHGQCRAGTALVTGRRVNSCLPLAASNDGAEIFTIERVGADGVYPLQAPSIEHDIAFIRQRRLMAHGSTRFIHCTSGKSCSALSLIAEGYAHAVDEIGELRSGNLRRGGPTRIY